MSTPTDTPTTIPDLPSAMQELADANAEAKLVGRTSAIFFRGLLYGVACSLAAIALVLWATGTHLEIHQ